MAEEGTFQTYRWSIFNSDYSRARTDEETEAPVEGTFSHLYCPVFDKDRWLGDNSRGISSLIPNSNGEIFDW